VEISASVSWSKVVSFTSNARDACQSIFKPLLKLLVKSYIPLDAHQKFICGSQGLEIKKC